jgi:hypothetical protein
MKLSFIVLLLLISGWSIAQTPKCKKVHNGRFRLTSEVTGTSIITRNGDVQTEENEKIGVIIEYKVEWVNECTYKLTPMKVIKNDSQINFMEDLQLEVQITKVSRRSYSQTTTSKVKGVSMSAEMERIK